MTDKDGVKETPDSSGNAEADRNEAQHFRDWQNVESASDA